MIEGSGSGSRAGSGSIPLTSGSGSGRPKNTWIRWIRIRNTAISAWWYKDPDPDPEPDPYIWLMDADPEAQKHTVRIRNTEKPTMKMLFSRNWYLNVNFGDFSGANISSSCRRSAVILCRGGRYGRGGHRLGDRRDAQHPYPRPQVGGPLPLLLFAAAGGAPPLQLSRARVAVCVAATAPEAIGGKAMSMHASMIQQCSWSASPWSGFGCGSGSYLSLWFGSGSCLPLWCSTGSYFSLWCGSGSGS